MTPSFTVAFFGVMSVTSADRENPAESVECPTRFMGGLPGSTILPYFLPNLKQVSTTVAFIWSRPHHINKRVVG